MANLIELFDNIVQMQNLNGVPLANGKLYVYALGRTRLMDTWSDVDGESLNTNPIILDDAGQAHCFVSDDFDYTLVVCDAYDNEIFSIDKYLYSKGEHSHADVAVAPSEHIGVSSYHVGETTVYVPYIQGELGKTYHGIEPIVVNNQENKISARNIPLGVQSPLYFAEDSESACIIGMSGEYQPVTGMSGYATTGDLVDLATSVSETYQPKGDYATHDDLSGFMEESKLETADGKITGYDGTAFAGGGSVDPSEFIPWSASGNFATSGDLNGKLDTTAFSTVSGDFITAIPDSYASKDFVLSSVSSKLDSTAFSTVSGDFITALPQGLLNESGFEYDGDKISAYNGSAFVGQGGGELSGYELSAGNGISIDNYPIEQKTVISVTGNYATEDWVTGQGYLTAETDWTDTITAASANAYNEATAAIPTGLATTGDLQTVSGEITAMIPTGNYVTADVLSSYILEDSAFTVSSIITDPDTGSNTGIAEYGVEGIHLVNISGNQYTTGTGTELSLRPEGLSGYSGYNSNCFNINPSGVSGSIFTTARQYHLSPDCVSGNTGAIAWSYGDKFTNAGFIVKQYGFGYFIADPEYSGSNNSIAINNQALTASGGSGNSARTIVSPYDVQVTSYNGQKTYSLASIGDSQPTTGNMAGYKYIDFPYKLDIFGHTANIQEVRHNLTGFNVDATFNNESEGIISGAPWYSYVNIPFTASSDTYDINWNFTGGHNSNGFTAAVLANTAEQAYTATSIASAYFSGKSGVLNVTGLTENTTYYLYVYGSAPYYGSNRITPFTAKIGSALWYNYTATSAGFIIPDEPVLTFKVIGD